MCAVSMVGDFYRDKWTVPGTGPLYPNPVYPPINPLGQLNPVTREEFDNLRKEVLDMKELLKRAKEYDEKTGQPDCEMDEKMEILRKVAKMVGVDLDDVLGSKK